MRTDPICTDTPVRVTRNRNSANKGRHERWALPGFGGFTSKFLDGFAVSVGYIMCVMALDDGLTTRTVPYHRFMFAVDLAMFRLVAHDLIA